MADELSERLEAEAARTKPAWTSAPTMNPPTKPVHDARVQALLREAAELARRTEAQPNLVYAAEWNDCVYESSFAVVSLHRSKAEAWREGRKKAWLQAVEDRETTIHTGYDFARRSWAWRVRPIAVK